MKKLLAACGVVALAAGCMAPGTGLVATGNRPAIAVALKSGVPAYRFVRGARRPSLGATFAGELGARWFPGMASLLAPEGLVSYVSALPPSGTPDLPDEMALAAYESPAVHDQAWASAGGQTLRALQGTLFDLDRTVSTPAVRWSATAPLEAEVPYDVMQQPTDWQEGVTTFFIGRREDAVPAADFLSRLAGQVRRERRAFEGQGLNGYVFWATPDYKVSFMHWTDLAAFGRAMQSPQGQEVVADSRGLMQAVLWTRAMAGPGAIAPGQAMALRFERRGPHKDR